MCIQVPGLTHTATARLKLAVQHAPLVHTVTPAVRANLSAQFRVACVHTSSPAALARVTWRHNGRRLEPGPRHKVSHTRDTVRSEFIFKLFHTTTIA